jgi:uncharacterized paraquat-inducible protein A
MVKCDNCGLEYLDAYKDKYCPRCKNSIKEIEIIDRLEDKKKEMLMALIFLYSIVKKNGSSMPKIYDIIERHSKENSELV